MIQDEVLKHIDALLSDGHTQLEVALIEPAATAPDYRIRIVSEDFDSTTLSSLMAIADRRGSNLAVSRVEGLSLE